MMKYSVKCILLLMVVTIVFGCKEAEYDILEGFTQGTTYRIVYSKDAKIPEVLPVVEEIFRKVDFSMSGYNPESDLSKINRGENVIVSDIFINVFEKSKKFYNLSGGYFDVSAAPIFDMWGFGFEDKSVVTKEKIDSVRQFVGMDKLEISDRQVVKSDARMKLNFNAIAKGYTSDLIGAAFDSMGISNYMIEIGGEIFCKGNNPGGAKWNIGIDSPEDGNLVPGEDMVEIILVSGCGVATSGDYRKFYMENGIKYAHTIDPVSGYPARQTLLSATVVAEDAMTADAYATFFMVVGYKKAVDIIESTPGIDGYLIHSDGADGYTVYKSSGIETR